MIDQLVITILHRIPGRIRIRLSQPPGEVASFIQAIKNHPGIDKITYTPVTGSLLAVFDPAEITHEELIVRTAVSLSRDYDMLPVQVLPGKQEKEMSGVTFYSALLLILSVAFRMLKAPRTLRVLMDNIAAIGTAAAVIEHSTTEIKEKGHFHPEVLSIIYLFNSAFKKRLFTGSVITWLATFGRHLFKPMQQAVEIKVMPVKGGESQNIDYETTVSPIQKKDDTMKLFRLVPEMLVTMVMTFSGMGEQGLLEKIRKLSDNHDQFLEGLENIKQGIAVRI